MNIRWDFIGCGAAVTAAWAVAIAAIVKDKKAAKELDAAEAATPEVIDPTKG